MSCLEKILMTFSAFLLLCFSYSILMQTAWSDQSATIIGALISGLMTIGAGYLAFRETRKANEIAQGTQAQLLLIERIKAANLVRSDVIDVYKTINDICELPFDGSPNKTFKSFLALQDPPPEAAMRLYNYFGENFPTAFDLKSKLADSLAILPDAATEELRELTRTLEGVKQSYKAVETISNGLVDTSACQQAIKVVFEAKGEKASLIDEASSRAQKAILYFTDLRDAYRQNYNAMVGRILINKK